MSYPPPTPPPPGFPPAGGAAAAAGGNDRSQLLGIIGIVAGICCPIAGIILGVVSNMQASKYGSSKTWGTVAIVVSVVMMVLGAVYSITANS